MLGFKSLQNYVTNLLSKWCGANNSSSTWRGLELMRTVNKLIHPQITQHHTWSDADVHLQLLYPKALPLISLPLCTYPRGRSPELENKGPDLGIGDPGEEGQETQSQP